ncbi:hypothetical protein [Variovorax sp. JS1663]|uniref:hypothetical protein n=1 Tax=Variovorax sp. JS1663 TaxID=1851577 RepID=UPI000B344F4A|nr:hypothetical protein [Variovorax sp. JS1663]OUM02779.1 hypothetical protein A8M77_09270 [Variovorax sp. JS1663]
MSPLRRHVLRADAAFLGLASVSGLLADVIGVTLGLGPQGPFLSATPSAAVGFIEAHGLAFVVGLLLWHAAPTRSWHLTATAVHLLLGTVNLAFWQFFMAADMLAVGYVTTLLHILFVLLQFYAMLEAHMPARLADRGHDDLRQLDEHALRDIGLAQRSHKALL